MSGVVGVFAIGGTRVPCDPCIHKMSHLVLNPEEVPLEFNDHRLQLKAGLNPSLNQSSFHCHETGVFVWLQGHFLNQELLISRISSQGAQAYNQAELLLRLYQAKGLLAIPTLKGQFTALIWDPSELRFILLRDPLGAYELYTRHDGDNLWFSTELKALKLLSPARIHYQALYQVMMFGTAGSQTLIEKVDALEAGELLVAEKGRIRKNRYWQLLWEESYHRPIVSELQEILGRSVDLALHHNGKEDVLLVNPKQATPVLNGLVETQTRFAHAVHSCTTDVIDYVAMVKAWGQPITSFEALPWIMSIMNNEPETNMMSSLGEDIFYGFHTFFQRQRWLQRQPMDVQEFSSALQGTDRALLPFHFENLNTCQYFNRDYAAFFLFEEAQQKKPLEWSSWSDKEKLTQTLFYAYLQPLYQGFERVARQSHSHIYMPFMNSDHIEWLLSQHPRFHMRGVVGGQLLEAAYGDFLKDIDMDEQEFQLRNCYQHEQIWSKIWPQCSAAIQDGLTALPFEKQLVLDLLQRTAVSRGQVSAADRRALVFLSSFAVWYFDFIQSDAFA